ncbi:MAG: FumA C-terminus/TtdB family hydratase beta subunit [Candidatus Micrarchaeota archaeon]
MKSFDLKTPLKTADVLALKVGDAATVSGTIYSMRDQAIRRILDGGHGKDLPDLRGAAVYNCGPLARKIGYGKWELVSAGPTTSSRLNPLMPRMINDFGITAIIGKGGMDDKVLKAMKGKCVYLSAVGGSGVISAMQLKVLGVKWLDLGMPEAMWTLQADKLGPLIVTMDASGNSLYDKVSKKVARRLQELVKQ